MDGIQLAEKYSNVHSAFENSLTFQVAITHMGEQYPGIPCESGLVGFS